MKKIFGANWKLNPVGDDTETSMGKAIALTDDYAKEGLADLNDREVLLFVPSPFIPELYDHIREKGYGFRLGAQNVSEHPGGNHTGQISVRMMAESGVTEFLIAHSERRDGYEEKVAFALKRVHEGLEKTRVPVDSRIINDFAEEAIAHTNEMYNRKILSILDYNREHSSGLRLIYCIGETLAEMEDGQADNVLRTQLDFGLTGVGGEHEGNVVIAYEPRWAIGGRKEPPTIEDIEKTHRKVKGMAGYDFPILYGGSINSGNAKRIMGVDGVDGGLIGNASLNSREFASIVLYDR